jgi:arylsulfatase A-like enzyme/Tfp pilus assembly protein PilF
MALRRAALLTLVAGAPTIVALGCTAGSVRREAGLRVLLVTVDTLRADALGAYGRAGAETPWMDRLAAEGVRFAEARAQNVVTLPSHANILSGRYPTDHGVRDNAGFRFPATTETLATLLKARGYRTGAFVSAFPLDSRFGLERGFDVYDDRFANVDTHTAFEMEERKGPETVALARDWIRAQGDSPWFCWVHLYEPHFPYAPPEPLRSRFASAPYQGEVAAADAALGPLLESVLAAGRGGRVLVVLTSDHGESLGEHGEPTHGIFAYEATLRVPLVLHAPRILRPRVVREPVRHVDVLPTVLDALGLDPPPRLAGRSLLASASGATLPPRESYLEALSSARNRGWAPLFGLVKGPFKYVDLPLPELYDLASDPGESRNLAAREPQRLEEMKAALARAREGDRGWEGGAEDEGVRERLRGLGYVAAARAHGSRTFTDADDPKRLIALDAELQGLIEQYQSGDLPGAIARGERLVAARPSMPLAWVQLGFLHRERGDLSAAIDSLQKALALAPEDSGTAALLGAYLTEGGRPREAIRVLDAYAGRPDPDLDVVIARGVALAAGGRSAEAEAAFAVARRLDPSNALPLVNLGTLYLGARDYVKAQSALLAALELNPRVARAHNALGVIAAETGAPEQAITHWKLAVALEPREFDTLFNLGALLVKSGRSAEARPYLERFLREAPRALYRRDFSKVRTWLDTAPPA